MSARRGNLPADVVFGGHSESPVSDGKKCRPEIDARLFGKHAVFVEVMEVISYALFAVVFKHLKIAVVANLSQTRFFYGVFEHLGIARMIGAEGLFKIFVEKRQEVYERAGIFLSLIHI